MDDLLIFNRFMPVGLNHFRKKVLKKTRNMIPVIPILLLLFECYHLYAHSSKLPVLIKSLLVSLSHFEII